MSAINPVIRPSQHLFTTGHSLCRLCRCSCCPTLQAYTHAAHRPKKIYDEVQNDENPVGPLASQTRAVGAIFGSDGGQADDNEKAGSIRPGGRRSISEAVGHVLSGPLSRHLANGSESRNS